MNTSAEATVEPYPGLASFQDRNEDRKLFFGREDAARALLQTTITEKLTVLYGRSGVGKTSLINAGLLQNLREHQYFPIVVRLSKQSNELTSSIISQIKDHAAASGVELKTVRRVNEDGNALWSFLANTDFILKEEQRPDEQVLLTEQSLRPFLIFDQFEELFTIVGDEESNCHFEFSKQLSDLIRGHLPKERSNEIAQILDEISGDDDDRKELIWMLYEYRGPDVRVLISIREDYLAYLDELRDDVPNILRNSFRLGRLSVEQASDAIEKPGEISEVLRGDTFRFQSDALGELLRFLRGERRGDRIVEGDSVEPGQLQILCHELNRRRRRRKSSEVTPRDTGGMRGLERIMSTYYKNVLRQFPLVRVGWNAQGPRPSPSNFLALNFPRAAIGKLCSRGLILRGMYRNSLMVEECKVRFGVPEGDLQKLEHERLLRIEPRLGNRFYELIHDTLVEPVRRYHRYRTIVARCILSVILVAVVSLPFSLPKLIDSIATAVYLYQVKDDTSSHADRTKAFRRLTSRDYTSLSGLRLPDLELDGIELFRTDLSYSKLQESKLAHAELVGVRFVGADLSDVSLQGAFVIQTDFDFANLEGADLAGAHIRHSSFVESELKNTNFNGARLLDVDLEGANLRGANVDKAEFTGVNLKDADLSGIAWWLVIRSATRETISELEKRWPPSELENSVAYAKDISELYERIASVQKDGVRSLLLNKLAWYRAIRGIDLAKALEEVEESLTILKDSGRVPDGARLNTKGYILLQLGRSDEALEFLQMAVDHEESTKSTAVGLVNYHLALALEETGDASSAKKFFDKAKETGYVPTYELLLTPPEDPNNYGWKSSE